MNNSTEEKKYTGYGYHGGGRPKKAPEDKKIYKTISISGVVADIDRLKALAEKENKTVSRFIFDLINK